ncbi:hypothetical protein [Embleya sp. NPDC020630]|uniref:hypothetical protein n=1 Tax=Embleya sp. NPDC020630 TaxID=3363979 RepID=UPI0037A15BFA
MNRITGSTRALLATAALLLVAGTASTATANTGRWTSEQLPPGNVSLAGYAKPDAHTTWAAGFGITESSFAPVLYAKDDHDDRGWVEVPTAPGYAGRINAVAASSARDAWLVGDKARNGTAIATQHWDGTSWSVVAADAPAAASSAGYLSVVARSPTDAWAAGWATIVDGVTTNPNGEPTQVIHREGIVGRWNGTSWQRMTLPQPYPSWNLNAITVVTANDVWAVGNGTNDDDKPVTLHYDGHAWSIVPTPAFTGLYGELYGVVAHGPNDVWAVGRAVLDPNDGGHALIMRWNGHAWRQTPVPAEAGALVGAATVPGGIVAVGQKATSDAQPYGLHITAGQAHSLDLPAPSPGGAYYPSAVGVDRGRVTIVGSGAQRARILTGHL